MTSTVSADTATAEHALTDLGAALRHATGGSYGDVREEARRTVGRDLMVRDPAMSMAQARAWTRQTIARFNELGMAASSFPVECGGRGDTGRSVIDFETTAFGDLSVTIKSGVQFGLFGGAVHNLGTDYHLQTWLPRIASLEIPGSFAMTEVGHGSDVASLETTLTYDRESDEIVVHSPSPAATKTYIGNAAEDAQMAVVFGQLIVDDTSHGVHAALVPVRDSDGNPLPGVVCGDNGAKGGLAGVDNGTFTFDQVRVPRLMLLDRYGGITEDGTYVSDIESPNRRFFTMLGTLVRGRICVAVGANAATRKALTIATRYALQRRQFSAPGHDGEVLLVDYQAHQRKLFPAIAASYAYLFALNDTTDRLQELSGASAHGHEAQRELEARAAGLKAVVTRFANDTIQTCREACGGAGYMAENGLTLLRQDADVFATFEGDNTVLLQLVAKGLLSQYKELFGDLDMFGMVRFAARSMGGIVLERTAARPLVDRLVARAARRSEDETLLDRGWHLAVFQDREDHLLETLANRMRNAAKQSDDSFEAFNATQDHVLRAARAHVDRVVLESFVAGIDACTDEAAKHVLERLCDLYVLANLEADAGWLQAHNRMSAARTKAVTAQVSELCRELRPDIEGVVDGLGVVDAWLGSAMLTERAQA